MAQTPAVSQQKQQQLDDSPLNRPVSEVAKIFDQNELRLKQQTSPVARRQPDERYFNELQRGVPKFRNAALQFLTSVDSGGDPHKPAKDIGKQTDVFLRYLKENGSQGQGLDSKELEKLKPAERTEETIRLIARVYRYVSEVLVSENEFTQSVEHLEKLSNFEKEARRLKWLSSHLN